MSDVEIPLFPVASWTIGPVPFHGFVTVRLDYLENESQDPLSPTVGKHFVLTPKQTRELIADLQKGLQKLEMFGAAVPPDQTH